MKNRYNAFTKQELAEFLQKYEKGFSYIKTPFDIMADIKMKKIMEQIDEHNKKSVDIKTQLDFVEHHEEWEKLDKEYQKWNNLRFGKEINKSNE